MHHEYVFVGYMHTDTMSHPEKEVVVSKINEQGQREYISCEPKTEKSRQTYTIPPEYYNLGGYLLIPVLIFFFSGYYLDKRFGYERFFTVTGIIAGAGFVLYSLYRLYGSSRSAHQHKR